MKRKKVQQLEHGLYKIWWKSGGTSVAAVGSGMSGDRWIAPTNWIDAGITDHCWRDVKKVKLLHSR